MTLNTTRWRKHPQSMRLKAAFVRPVVVLDRRVNQASFTYPLAQVTYDDPDGGDGAYTDVQPHMTLAVYDGTTGDLKGLARVRKAPTSSVIYLNETAQGEIAFADNDRLVVYDDYRLWARVPRITSSRVFYKDYDLAYSDEFNHPPPVANAGPHIALDADPDTGVATVTFDAGTSFRLAVGITDALSYSWDVKDGTITVGTSSDASITVTFPPGQRWVEVTVTDANGKTARAVAAVLVCDDETFPAVPVQLARLTGTVETGWEAAVRVLAEDVSDLLPGALMVLYADETYGDEDGPVQGIAGREGVKFAGWLATEDVSVEPLTDTLTLTARGPLGVMRELAAYSVSIEQSTEGGKWHHMYMPSAFRAFCYTLQWHSTVTLVCDLDRPVDWWDDLMFKAVDLTGSTLLDQVQALAGRAWARLTSDRAGRLYFERNPHLMTDTERAALSTVVSLDAADWRQAVQIERRARRPVGRLSGGGFTSHVTSPILKLAEAPGAAPGEGPGSEEVNGQFIEDQDDLNIRLGHMYAWRNLSQPSIQLTLNHQGLPLDPAWNDVVALTVDPASNRRGVGFSAAQMVPTRLEVGHDAERGVTTETLTLEPLAYGAPASTVPVPDGDWEASDWTPPPPSYTVYTPPPPPGGTPPAFGLVYAATKSVIRRTRDYGAATPSWETVYTPPGGWEVREFKLDQFDPKNAALAVITDSSSQTTLLRTSNLDATTPTWTALQTLPYPCAHPFLRASFFEGTWFLGMYVGSEVYRVFHTHDTWATYTNTFATSHTHGARGTACEITSNPGGLDDGLLYVGERDGAIWLRRSIDYGGSFSSRVWVRSDQSGSYPPHWAVFPWWGNEDNQELWVGGGSGPRMDAYLYVSFDAGLNWENRAPVYDGYTWGGGHSTNDVPMRPMLMFVTNPDIIALAAYRSVDKRGHTNPRLFVSTDRGETWTHRGQFSQYVTTLGGWPYDSDILLATGPSAQRYSDDFGLTWVDKHWVGYAGGVDTIPVWLE